MRLVTRLTDTFHELAVIYFGTVLSATWIFHVAEHKPFFDSLWWAFVTAMTVGYGDLYPITAIGRIDAVVLMHLVPLVIIPLVVARFLSTVMEDHDKFTDEEQRQLMADVAYIKKVIKYHDEK